MTRRELVTVDEDERAVREVVHEFVVLGLHPPLVIETVCVRSIDWITLFAGHGHECGSYLACQLGYAE